MKENYLIADLNDFEETYIDTPIIMTYSSTPFIAFLINAEETAFLMNIELTTPLILAKLIELLNEIKDGIENVEIFFPKGISNHQVDDLYYLFKSYNIYPDIYPLFDQDGIESIGYNRENKEYYGVVFHTINMGLEKYEFKKRKQLVK